MTADFEDTSTWLPLDGLEPGFDANRAPHSTGLDGTDYVLHLDGARVRYRFDAAGITRTEDSDTRTSAYETVEVDEGLYYVQFHPGSAGREAFSLVLDLHHGCALEIRSIVGDVTDRPTVVTQVFRPGTVDGVPVTAPAPAPSADLVGRRVLWEYSPDHHYEHLYLTDRWYSFVCLSGPERGLADTDACAYYRIRPGIYVFAWREKVIPCAAVTVADHRVFRSHGALFGLHEDLAGIVHFTFGAHGRLLGAVVYPDGLDARAEQR